MNANKVKINATETTTVKGAVVNTDHLQLDTKNLHIESVQDREKYDSKQTQAGASASVAIYGSGSSVSAQASRNKANVDYAQVTTQSGFNIKQSSAINVAENTHLKGGIINAAGDSANHRLKTGTLTTEDIQNHSDIEISSVSVGASTDMSQMAGQVISAALSALGNKSEHESSTTKSAISGNVQIQLTDNTGQQQKTGKTAEETLATLNRDTVNANEKVAKQDLTKIQERQEMAQVIGELSQSWLNRAVKAPLEEADKKRQEAEKVEKTNPAQAERLRSEAKALEAEYGFGSNLQMGVRAATAALQGLATGDVKQAAVGAISPYLNKAIKEATTNADGSLNKEANLIAHTILGVVEAKATGNNAVAGGLAALTAEAAAPIVMQQLYGTDNPANLTEKQKQNVANISQITAGLTGGLVGDSTASGISGAEIGKRAVENNYLKAQESLAFEKEMVVCKSSGGDCTDIIQKYIEISNRNFAELGLNKCKGGGVVCVTKEEIVQAETNVALVKHDSHGRFYLGESLRDDDTINLVKYLNGNDLSYLRNNITTSDRLAAVVMDPTSWPVMLMGAKNILGNNTKANLLGTGISVGLNAGAQYGMSGQVGLTDLIAAGLVSQTTAGKGFSATASWNMVGGYYTAKIKGDSPYESALLSKLAAQGGYAVGKVSENTLQPIFNPYGNSYGAKAWKDIGMGMSKSIPPSYVPSYFGSFLGSVSSESINYGLKEGDEK